MAVAQFKFDSGHSRERHFSRHGVGWEGSSAGRRWTCPPRRVYRRHVGVSARLLAVSLSGVVLGLALGLGISASACTTVDPGPTFVVPDEQFDADFFFCRVEPEVLTAKRCGAGDPAAGDAANGCHFNASAVSGMALVNHAPIDCANGRPVNRAQLGAGSGAQGNLQAASLVMSRDIATAPIFVRPTGQNHPRAIFPREDPVAEVLREWARR